VVNAVITTISRSGFLALGVGGVIFNYFAPRRLSGRIRIFSALGLILFMSLAGAAYWDRISSITYAGEEVEGVDTGAGRLVIMQAQWKMFQAYPLGCGHRCTATLSPDYLPRENLTREGARSSHNTFMTLLVEQGIPGVIFYLLMLIWLYKTLIYLRRETKGTGLLSTVFPTIAAVLGAIVVGDLFVDYLKLEVRIWFFGLMMVMTRMVQQKATQRAPKAVPAGRQPYAH
jgi:O-antigen ligase